MAYPTTYERVVGVSGFTTHSTNFPTTPHTGANLDSEFNTLRSRTTEMLVFLAGITRSDGALANGIVTQDSLSEDIYAGINPPSPWVTATAYTLRDSVTINGILYRCIVAHTSGVFATDLAAAKWTEVIDFVELIGDIALSDDTPTTISAGVGSAGTADFAARADHSHPYTAPTVYPTDLSYGGVKTADFTFAAGLQYIVCTTGTAITARSPTSPTQNDRTEFVKVGANNFTIELAGNTFNGSSTNPVSSAEGVSTLIFAGLGRGYTEQ